MAVNEDIGVVSQDGEAPPTASLNLVWFPNIFAFLVMHTTMIYAFVYVLPAYNWSPMILTVAIGWISGMGITAGAHRLWAHRAYKAKLPLRIFLMLCNCSAGQDDIYIWCRDHRLHHKYTETNADPYTITRGLFFAHMGWLMVRKHPDVYEKGKGIDCSDLLNDPVVAFQRKAFYPLSIFLIFVLPTWAYVTIYGMTIGQGLAIATTRYLMQLHFTWCINSLAHYHGPRPYDDGIKATENLFSKIFILGEGFHNYHHVFPFDYKATELNFTPMNSTTMFINFMARIGQAYDLKEASQDIVKKRMEKSGDGFIY